MSRARIFVVAGTRPNFMKAAPVLRALDGNRDRFETFIVHTGQHYDREMSEVFFSDLGIRAPDIQFELRTKAHSGKIAEIMNRVSSAIEARRPDLVVVFGDVNSTIAAALMALKHRVRIAHVEAGLRCFDRRTPEELNRVLTDHISDFLFTSEESANSNLRAEGCGTDRVFFVGNTMIDSLIHLLPAIRERAAELEVGGDAPLALVTIHRQENVDERHTLDLVLEQVQSLGRRYHVFWPMHPMTSSRIDAFGLQGRIKDLEIMRPLGYVDFMAVMTRAAIVVTDSGGIQEETTYLGVPCYTLRDSTERPVTVELGTNVLIRPNDLRDTPLLNFIDASRNNEHRIPPLWDGRASERIVRSLRDHIT